MVVHLYMPVVRHRIKRLPFFLNKTAQKLEQLTIISHEGDPFTFEGTLDMNRIRSLPNLKILILQGFRVARPGWPDLNQLRDIIRDRITKDCYT